MIDFDEKLSELGARLEKMVEYQEYFYREINQLRDEIKSLNQSSKKLSAEPKYQPSAKQPPENARINRKTPPNAQRTAGLYEPPLSTVGDAPKISATASEKSNFEEFVGRNLISIVGIIITIIGVGIGAKYAIDNELISPGMRILAGYSFGGALFGVAVWLKPKYLNFSAVLLSGALAILYFITYFAHGFYDLLPQSAAFLLMLLVTIATVGAAINYNRQIIAHIGLVGAYAVPFLISNNAGSAAILFGYITIINFGVLAVSVRKYWKPLFYNSFGFTWLVYAAWYLSNYKPATDFSLAILFLTVFFLTFYATFIAYKLIAREEFRAENIFLLLANSFVFYGLGSAIIASQPGGSELLGLFTLLNAALHFIVAATAKKYAFVDRGNLNFLAALGLIFVTLAIPVQLSGHLVTLLWTAEAAVLFFVGRTKKLPLGEYFSYPLMVLASVSLANYWAAPILTNSYTVQTPILNSGFVTAILFVAGLCFIYGVYKKHATTVENSFADALKYLLPTTILFVLYNTFRIEIGNYFESELARTTVSLADDSRIQNNDLNLFNFVWQLNYSMFFLTVLAVVNARRIKSNLLGLFVLGLSCVTLLIFLAGGLYVLDELRASYLAETDSSAFTRSDFHLVIRYISLLFVAGLFAAAYKHIADSLNNRFPELKLNLTFDFVFYLSLLWIVSSELLNWSAILRINDADRLGLSILWGVYALMLVIVGIVQRKKHLRIGAIVLFAFALVKLFFYDIAALNTISKTVVFVSLGILLLTISFLYNKYKHLIFDEGKV